MICAQVMENTFPMAFVTMEAMDQHGLIVRLAPTVPTVAFG